MPARYSDRARCLLAFDTAGTACSAAIWRDGAVCARQFEAMSRGQSERLVPMIEAVMAEAGVAYPALDAIAVTCGPGGFTGVRIGLATARALALACARPVIGISNFEAVAAAVPESARAERGLAVVIDAKRSDLYVQAFGPGLEPATLARAIAPRDLDAFLPEGSLLLVGDSVDTALAELEAAGRDVVAAAAPGQADASVVATLAASRPLPAAGTPPPGPIYLRGPDVTLAPPPRNESRREPGTAP
jgi:tRNA threonylcarbamoyladenosine biosynthesis protein TsaB